MTEEATRGAPKAVKKYMGDIGRKGGKAGKGDAKRRPSDGCSRAGKLGAKSRWGNRQNQPETDPASQEAPPAGQQSSPPPPHTSG